MPSDAPTPDTLAYLILGFVVISILVGGFLGSLALRYRNLQQDLKTIQQLNDDQ